MNRVNVVSFLVKTETDNDSDEEDLDRYTDVGLKEQLFVTLSRTIPNTQNANTNTCVTNTASIRQKTILLSATMKGLKHMPLSRQCTDHDRSDTSELFNEANPTLIPNFEHLHQTFGAQLKTKIFDNNISSNRMQREFMSITPQDIGLMDFSNIRSQRRATLGFEETSPKAFMDHESILDIPHTQRDKQLMSFMYNIYKENNEEKQLPQQQSSSKPWHKLFSFGINKKTTAQGTTDDEPSDVVKLTNRYAMIKDNETKDDMVLHNDTYEYAQTVFDINNMTQCIKTNELKRGDLIFIMDYEMIDIQNEDKDSFIYKYKYETFLNRMKHKDIKRRSTIKERIQTIRKQSIKNQKQKQKLKQRPKHKKSSSEFIRPPSDTSVASKTRTKSMHLNSPQYTPPKPPCDTPLNELRHTTRTRSIARSDFVPSRPRAKGRIKETDTLSLSELERLDDWNKRQSPAHCVLVLQNIGSSVEVAHVTAHGALRSFIKDFDAQKLVKTLYTDHMHKSETFCRGPPVAYRGVVYRLNTEFVATHKLVNEAANVAENLVKTGRVLHDPKHYGLSIKTYLKENPEKYFDKFLLNNSFSLFRRTVRLEFDTGTNFMCLSSSEFVALCFQRALVNKKTFDRQLIRLLDIYPHSTPPSLLQKYLHLNIDRHNDWKCIGNTFFYYL